MTSPRPAQNVFLHFLNRDSLMMYGATQNLLPGSLTSILAEYLVIASLLADDYCIVPPGWVDEYDVTKVVLQRHVELIQAGLIRFPIREVTLDEFHRKRLSQYGRFAATYPDLFAERNVEFLHANATALIGRRASVGSRIRREWAEQAISDPTLSDVRASLGVRRKNALIRVADRLTDEGSAIAWPGVKDLISPIFGSAPQGYRHLLQRLNFEVYLREYGLKIVSRLPLARFDFGLAGNDLSCDYVAFRAALEAAQVWQIARALDGPSIIRLRNMRGFLDFRRTFETSSVLAASSTDIRRDFAPPPRECMKVLRQTADLDRFESALAPPPCGYHLTESDLQQLAARLQAAAKSARHPLEIKNARARRIPMTGAPDGRGDPGSGGPGVRLAIFVALDVELQVLVRRWKLRNSYGDPLWRGTLGRSTVAVYSPRSMGRVQAALETADLLRSAENEFDMLIVAGLAGGFKQKGVRQGSLLIAESVVDLAFRRISEEDEDARPVFRPKEFAVDSRLREFLQSGSFDKSSWLGAVVDEEEWPDGLRPVLHYGPICSCDEVVSSDDWVQRLLGAWPMLQGVEMEAGGVCAAAERNGRRAAVVRVVSDLADPAKADDEWRRRGMKTIANLLEHLDFAEVCRGSSRQDPERVR